MSLRVKICGITRIEDGKLAEACGANALGFIFYAPSQRSIAPEEAARIVAGLHPYTVKVGVFVQETARRMNEIADRCRLDRIQLHGGEPHGMLAELNRPAYRALRLGEESDFEAARAAPDDTLMLDTFDPELYGGTGRPFNWEWAREVGVSHRVILAGGLSPDNIARAVECAQPAAVDASSSLEAAPGIKDPEKVRSFFDALKGIPQKANPKSGTNAIAI